MAAERAEFSDWARQQFRQTWGEGLFHICIHHVYVYRWRVTQHLSVYRYVQEHTRAYMVRGLRLEVRGVAF